MYFSMVDAFINDLEVKNTLAVGEWCFSSVTATLPVSLNKRTGLTL